MLPIRDETNPYSAPEAQLVDPGTPGSGWSRSETRAAVKSSLIQQAVFFIPATLTLDGGRSLRVCVVASLASWAATALILGRRAASPTRSDLFIIRFGFWFFLVVVIASAGQWSLRWW